MQHDARTPSSILKRQRAEEAQARRGLRHKGGRRVSFAPDEELETMHLYQVKGLSPPVPAAASQEVQPLSELPQNISSNVGPGAYNPWAQQAPAACAPPASPACSTMSMELTGDTMDQRRQVLAAAGGLDESDSLPLPPFQHSSMHNITDNIPGLSTLIEEDEEGDAAAAAASGSDAGQDQTMEMDLTGTTGPLQPVGGAEEAAPTPKAGPSPRRSSRRKSMESPAPAAPAAAAAGAVPDAAVVTSPPSTRRTTRGSSVGAAGGSAVKATPPKQQAAGRKPSISPMIALSPFSPLGEVSPSPLRRVTRSLSRDLSPLPELPPPRASTAAAMAGAMGPPAAAAGAAGGRRRGRESLALAQHQQSKWGFVPGDDDTLMMGLDCHGRGGLGENTLHHVYSESAGTGDITLAAKKGALAGLGPGSGDAVHPQEEAAAGDGVDAEEQEDGVAAPAAAAAAELEEEEEQMGEPQEGEEPEAPRASAPPATPALLQTPATGAAAAAAAGRRRSLRVSGLLSPPAADAGALGDGDGLTTHLLLDEQALGAWGPPGARSSLGGGRGSVGSNVLTMHQRRGETPHLLGSTTQLLVEEPPLPSNSSGDPAAAAEGGGQQQAPQQQQGLEDCTTKLLADTTGASCSAPGVFGGFRPPLSLVAAAAGGGAGSPELLMGPPPRLSSGAAPASMAGAAAGGAAASPAGGSKKAAEGEVTLELHVTGPTGAVGLEDATLEEFALPPELGPAGRSSEGGPATMAFSGMLTGMARNGGSVPGSVLRTPGGSRRQPERITFQDFLQIVDLQFLDHIRRGTSINMMDLAPGPTPQNLEEALSLLSVTGLELGELEATLAELQEGMRAKRLEVHEREEALEEANPELFQHVQVVRRSELEGVKGVLASRKRSCRAAVAASWKALRSDMERRLAERLREEEDALREHLAFFQDKAQAAAAQQQALATTKASLQQQIAEQAAAAKAAEEARGTLARLRQALGSAQARNAERGRRLASLQQQQEELQAQAAQLEETKAALLARQAALQEAGSGSAGASQAPAAQQLVARTRELAVLQGLQPWQLTCTSATSWELRFCPQVAAQVSLVGGSATLRLLLAVAPRAGRCSLADTLLRDMVRLLPQQEEVPAAQLPAALLLLEGRLGRARALAAQAQAAFLAHDLLIRVEVSPAPGAGASSWGAGAGAGEGPAELVLTYVDPDAPLKLAARVPVEQLLLQEPRTGLSVMLDAPVCPQKQLVAEVAGAVAHLTTPGATALPGLLEQLAASVATALHACLHS